MRQRQTYQPKAARSERKASGAAAALSGDEEVRGSIRNNGAQQQARLQERGGGGWRGETFGCVWRKGLHHADAEERALGDATATGIYTCVMPAGGRRTSGVQKS